MMAEVLTLKRAQRQKAKLKLGIAAPSGGGKTFGALLIAYGLMKEKYPDLPSDELWSKIAVVDTENGSGQLYVGTVISNMKIGEYNTVTLTPPFEADKYTSAILMCHEAGMEVVIIDSTTHLWSGEGGLLEQQGMIAKRTGNSYTAWRDVTPMHNRFVDTMLQTDVHIIATMRSKTDYVQEKNAEGRTVVRKIGLNPIQKEGMEYEFTIFLEVDAEHNAFGSKDRTGLVDQKYFKITPQTGMDIMKWLESGVDVGTQSKVVSSGNVESNEKKTATMVEEKQASVVALCVELGGKGNADLMTVLKEYDPTGNPKKIQTLANLDSLLAKLENMKKSKEEVK